MAFFQRIKKIVTPFVNFPRWMGSAYLAEHGKTIIAQAKLLVTPAQPKYRESFEEAMRRLDLCEADITERKKQFTIYTLLFFTGTVALCFYSIFLLYLGSYKILFATIGLMLLLLGQTFRYHFWLFQMKQRRLGCTFSEWFNYGLLSKKK